METGGRASARALVALAVGISAVGVVCAATAAGLRMVGAPYPEPATAGFAWSDVVVGLAFPPVGALLVARSPRNLAGWVLISAASVGVSALAHTWNHQVGADPGSLPALGLMAWLANWTYVTYWLQPTLLPVLFPHGRPPSPRWRWFVFIVLGVMATVTLAAMFRPGPVDGQDAVPYPPVTNPLGIGSQPELLGSVQMVGTFSGIVTMPLALWCLARRLRTSEGRERSQLAWLVLGFLICAALILIPLPWETEGWGLAVAFAAIPLAVSMAVFHAGFLDIEPVVRRGVANVLVVMLAMAAALTLLWSAGLLAEIGAVSVAAVAGVTLVALAIHNRVQRVVDRHLFGLGTDAAAVMEHVGARLDEVATGGDALQRFVDALADALRLPHVSVVPRDPVLSTVERGHATSSPESFPIVADGREIAMLRVGRRGAGDRFTAVERTALMDASRRAGALLQTATLSMDLRRSHERLVVATEDERRRLSRELHDGLGPALAGMALQLDGLSARMSDDPELLQRADRLRNQLRAAVGEVRSIVAGLRPSALDQSSLATAVQGLAALDESRVEVAVQGDQKDLSAAVEVAAFRIAAEATANALRHGNPSRCQVRLGVDDGWLLVEVRDDGVGFSAGSVAGVGLSSMHERVAELGGDITTTPWWAAEPRCGLDCLRTADEPTKSPRL